MEVRDILVRITMAIVIGGFVGYEREMRNRPAGFITHTLVCVGACVVSLIQIQMIHDTIKIIEDNPILAASMKADLGRVVAQVVTGVGFLGAGTIIFDKGSVKGLTTATTIWVVACIGLAIGLGYYKISIISAIGIIFIIVVLKKLESKTKNKKFINLLEIAYSSNYESFVENTVKFFRENRVEVRDIKFVDSNDQKAKICRFVLYFGFFRNQESVIKKLAMNDAIISISKKKIRA